jgi:hypothetical protein
LISSLIGDEVLHPSRCARTCNLQEILRFSEMKAEKRNVDP